MYSNALLYCILVKVVYICDYSIHTVCMKKRSIPRHVLYCTFIGLIERTQGCHTQIYKLTRAIQIDCRKIKL